MTPDPDLTEDERTELSVHSPNLMCLLEREPTEHVAVTRANARAEVASLLREIRRLGDSMRRSGKTTLEFSRPELLILHDELGDVPARLIKPKLMSFYRRLGSLVGIDWPEEDVRKNRKRK